MKLLCIDFSNLIIRHAANPYGGATDDQNRNVQGPVGSIGQVIREISYEKPTHLLIAKDGPRSLSFRRQLDHRYKAHRKDADEDITRQFKLSYQALDLFSWPVVSEDSFEADDIIASAATQYPGEVVVLTGDRDLLALCDTSTSVHLLRPGGREIIDEKGCQKIFGVLPEYLTDYKALVGDASDGIVGVEGVGPKRALALLDSFITLENIYQQIDKDKQEVIKLVGNKITEKLVDNRDEAFLSYQLAKLNNQLPVDFTTLECPSIPRDEEYGEKLNEINLHSLRMHLPGYKDTQKNEPLNLESTFDNLFKN